MITALFVESVMIQGVQMKTCVHTIMIGGPLCGGQKAIGKLRMLSYIIRKIPYTVRSGSAFLYQMDPFVEEASINLGVSPMKTFFTVTARMMLPGIMSGAVLSWITCINELSSSIMLYSGKTSTIAVAIYQEVTRMSDGTAAALATILTLTTIVSLVIVFRVTKGKVKIV